MFSRPSSSSTGLMPKLKSSLKIEVKIRQRRPKRLANVNSRPSERTGAIHRSTFKMK